MRNILAIIERELRAYFISPVAYVVLTIFVFLSGLFFRSILAQVLQMGLICQLQAQQLGPRAMDMPGMITRGFLSTMSVILLFVMPMLTMGLFSEEKKRGTIELLLTAPLTDLQVVLGKFFAGVTFFLILLLTTWIPTGFLYLYSSPASGPILTAYLWLVDVLANNADSTTGKAVLTYLSIISHLDDFMKGVLSTSHIIFYMSLMLVALFLTYRSIDSLRWRG